MAIKTERRPEFFEKHAVAGAVGIMAEKTASSRYRSVGKPLFVFVLMARQTECCAFYHQRNGTLVGGVPFAGNRLVAGKTFRRSHRAVNCLALFVPQQTGVAFEATGLFR